MIDVEYQGRTWHPVTWVLVQIIIASLRRQARDEFQAHSRAWLGLMPNTKV